MGITRKWWGDAIQVFHRRRYCIQALDYSPCNRGSKHKTTTNSDRNPTFFGKVGMAGRSIGPQELDQKGTSPPWKGLHPNPGAATSEHLSNQEKADTATARLASRLVQAHMLLEDAILIINIEALTIITDPHRDQARRDAEMNDDAANAAAMASGIFQEVMQGEGQHTPFDQDRRYVLFSNFECHTRVLGPRLPNRFMNHVQGTDDITRSNLLGHRRGNAITREPLPDDARRTITGLNDALRQAPNGFGVVQTTDKFGLRGDIREGVAQLMGQKIQHFRLLLLQLAHQFQLLCASSLRGEQLTFLAMSLPR